jgi:formylglycine-generating enzyme required for sulfatase activity
VILDQPPRPRWGAPNGPIATVNWWEAAAFGRWLTARLQDRGELKPDAVVRLPSEWEWQQAATGGQAKRTYPWGDEFDPKKANWEGQLNRTSAVGLYPAGASPVGALDMAGNVWEWCLNRYYEPGYLGLDGDVPRVVRGGSWIVSRGGARTAYRGRARPGLRHDGLGFRLCVTSPIKKR